MSGTIILGAGVTGLAAGWSSGAPIYEAAAAPGGICASYYLRPGDRERRSAPPDDGGAYRFEIGGGHWIFGGDPQVLALLGKLTPLVRHERRASIFFADEKRCVPFPLQNHLGALDANVAEAARVEMANASGAPVTTLREWLLTRFGRTLCERFFFPFHARYTAGLYAEIAPQDSYKSPAGGEVAAAAYNQSFLYPAAGLDALARAFAARGTIYYGKRAIAIDVALPERPHPSSGVLVLNIGAQRGPRCPDDHWVYVPDSRAGFHRVGCYSNVDASFLPRGSGRDRVALYVERALHAPLAAHALANYGEAVVRELQEWGWIGAVEVCDPAWVDVAYTWAWPGSGWREAAIAALESRGITPVGRYARWTFQGIADSVRDGLRAVAPAH